MTQGRARAVRHRQAGRGRAAEAHRRRRRPEGRRAAVRQRPPASTSPGRSWRWTVASAPCTAAVESTASAMQFPATSRSSDLLGIAAAPLRGRRGRDCARGCATSSPTPGTWPMAAWSMTLLDVAMAHATRSREGPRMAPTRAGVVTIEMKTSFMRPAEGRMTCIGKLLHRRPRWPSAKARVRRGRRAAGARHRHLQVLSGLPAGGRRIQSPDASD